MKTESINSRLAFCLDSMDVSGDNLVPITGEEYESFVADLRRKVESNASTPGQDVPGISNTGEDAAYQRSFRFADWDDIVGSLENRIQEAYRVEGSVCSGCGGDGNVVVAFRSGGGSWRRFCGIAGYMLICTDCMRQLKFSVYSRS